MRAAIAFAVAGALLLTYAIVELLNLLEPNLGYGLLYFMGIVLVSWFLLDRSRDREQEKRDAFTRRMDQPDDQLYY